MYKKFVLAIFISFLSIHQAFAVVCSDDTTPGIQYCKICAVGSNCTDEDYNTIQDWENAKNGDLVTAQQIRIAECYDDDGRIDGNIAIDGGTTSANYYIEIRAASGERHNGTPSTGATLGITSRIDVDDDYVRFSDLVIDPQGTVNTQLFDVTGNYTTYKGNVLLSTAYNFFGISSTADPTYIINNIMIKDVGGDKAISGLGSGGTNGSIVANNTIIDKGTGTTCFSINAENFTLANNICQGWDATYSGYGEGGGRVFSNNLTSNSSGFPSGTNFYSTSLTFVDPTNNNYHLSGKDTAAINFGISMSPTFEDDIDGIKRLRRWDIGADEYPMETYSNVSIRGIKP